LPAIDQAPTLPLDWHLLDKRRFPMQRRMIMLTLAIGVALMFVSSGAVAQYQLRNLVSNQVKQAVHVDPLLVNAWGLARSAGSPFWISDEGSGWSTLYNGAGVKQGLEVVIPSADGFSSAVEERAFPLRNPRRNHQCVGASSQPECGDYCGEQLDLGRGLYRAGGHQ
jgi:hypothetical protein